MAMKELNGKRNASLRVSEALGLISQLIHVGQFKVDTANVLDDYQMDIDAEMPDKLEDIAKELDTNVETVKELEEVCSIESLHCAREDEVEDWDNVKIAPEDTGLAGVNGWIEVNRRRYLSIHLILKSKYTEFSCMMEVDKKKIKPKNEDDFLKGPETIITVTVNFPRSFRQFKHCAVNFHVLGSQKLSALRDAIPCALDEQPVGTFTDNPDHPRNIACKDIFKSGFFFIENVFFDDRRNSGSTELSKHILDWAQFNDIEIPSDLKCVNMDDYTFNDLTLRLGSPYLYQHQGNCEHIIIFKDIRLLHPDDCRAISAYPLAISRARFKTILCKVCDQTFATWVTRFDTLSDEDPSFFCDPCFRKLHYTKDGAKAAEFEAYPFINRESLGY